MKVWSKHKVVKKVVKRWKDKVLGQVQSCNVKDTTEELEKTK